MPRSHRDTPLSLYLLAIALPLAALGVRAELSADMPPDSLLFLFIFPIALSAFLGGLGPGLTGTMASGVLTAVRIDHPLGDLAISSLHELEQWGMLVGNGLLISILSGVLHHARRREIRRIQQLDQTQEALRQSNEAFAATFRYAAVGMAEIAPDGRFILANPKLGEILGYEPQDLLKMSFRDITLPEDLAATEQRFGDLLSGRTPFFSLHKRCTHRLGQSVWTHVTASVVRDKNGTPLRAVAVIEDISAQKREQEARHAAETLYHAIVNSSEDAIVSKTLDSIITSWNPGAERLFGYRADEAIGKVMTLLFPPGHEDEERQIIGKIAAGQTIRHFESVRQRKDGTLIDVSITISPIHAPDGTIIGASKVARDITSRKREQAELERYRGQLEDMVSARTTQLENANKQLDLALSAAQAADKAKSQFLANMSHEIRTPMNAVLGFLGLALENDLPQATRRQLTTAHNAAKSLLLLINDILDLSKLQSGKIELEQIPFNLPRLLRSCIDMLGIKAREKKLELSLHFDDALRNCYLGDPMRVRQIVTNLLGNAIKFTESGKISVLVRPASSPGSLQLSVSDSGIGMSPEQCQKIFTPFVQADSSTTRRFGGTGLGVSICKQLANAMDGHIWVESDPGIGSTFHVVLPLPAMECDSICSEGTFAAEAGYSSQRHFDILLVDDIEENIELAEIRLTGQGHRVSIARNGRDAVTTACANDFDVILMDIHMPEMNGLDATVAIRRHFHDAPYRIPIIAMTASVLPSEQQQCFDAGMDSFVGKPIDFSPLFKLMDDIVPQERGILAPVRDAPRPPMMEPVDQDLPGIVWTDALQRWGEPSRYATALRKFFHNHSGVCDQLSHFVEQGDTHGARELVHALKGVSANLALSQVSAVTCRINAALKAGDCSDSAQWLADLEAALAEARASAQSLTIDSIADAPNLANAPLTLPVTALPVTALPVTALPVTALAEALATDDPDAVEAVIAQGISGLSAREIERIRALAADFEFAQARALLPDLSTKPPL